jgi:predicted peptidase
LNAFETSPIGLGSKQIPNGVFDMKQRQQPFRITVRKTVTLPYLVYKPENYQEYEEGIPLIFFLHGAGERGTDLDLVKLYGIPHEIESGREFPFLVVSPQCPEDTIWANELDALHALLERIIEEYNVDCSRIYLTGLSMGGNGAWRLAVSYPSMFAAVVPICGWTKPIFGFPERIKVLKDVPVWAFHGTEDDIISIKSSQELVDVLKANQGNVKFTIYPDTGHDAWTQTYKNRELYEWLLQQVNDDYSSKSFSA